MSLLVNKYICEASSGEVSAVMQMWSDGEGTGMLIKSQTVFPGSDFRLVSAFLFPLNPNLTFLSGCSLFQVAIMWKNWLPPFLTSFSDALFVLRGTS